MHVDVDDQRQLQSTNVANVEMLKKRLAELKSAGLNSDVWHLKRNRFGSLSARPRG